MPEQPKFEPLAEAEHKVSLELRYRKILIIVVSRLAGTIWIVLGSWPGWLPWVESDAGRFEKFFGRPPPAGVKFVGTSSSYWYDIEEISVSFELAPSEFAAFLPPGFRPVAIDALPDHTNQVHSEAVRYLLEASGVRECPNLKAFMARPWSGTEYHTLSDAVVLYCMSTGRAYAKGLGID